MIALGRILRLAEHRLRRAGHPRVAAAALRRGERGRHPIRLRPDRRRHRSAGGRRTAEPLPDEHRRHRGGSEPPDGSSSARLRARATRRGHRRDSASRPSRRTYEFPPAHTPMTTCAPGSPMTCCPTTETWIAVRMSEAWPTASSRSREGFHRAAVPRAGMDRPGHRLRDSCELAQAAAPCRPRPVRRSRSTMERAASTSDTASAPSGSADGAGNEERQPDVRYVWRPTERAAVTSARWTDHARPWISRHQRAPKVLLHDHLDGGLRPRDGARARVARSATATCRRPIPDELAPLVHVGRRSQVARAVPRGVPAHGGRHADARRDRARGRRVRRGPGGGRRSSTPRSAWRPSS